VFNLFLFYVPSVISKLPFFDVEIPMERIETWGKLYKQYRDDMSSALRDTSKKSNEEAAEVIKIYKQVSISVFLSLEVTIF